MHSTIESAAHSTPLNSLGHCICTTSMTNIRPARHSNPVLLSLEPQQSFFAILPCRKRHKKTFTHSTNHYKEPIKSWSTLPTRSYRIHLFIHLFIYSFIHLFIYSFIHLFIYAFIHLLIYSFIYLFIYLFIHLFIYSFIHLFIYSFIHLFIYSIIFFVSFIHLFIRSFILILFIHFYSFVHPYIH